MCDINKKASMTQSRHQTTLSVLLVLICLLTTPACQQYELDRLPTSTVLPTLSKEELPSFLLDVYPNPNDYVLQEEINSSIGPILAVLQIGEIVWSEDISNLEGSVNSFIDEIPIPTEIDITKSGNEKRVYVSTQKLQLGLGHHTATIQVTQPPPYPLLEYSWDFEVLAEEPAFPGLPEGFQFVRPLPDSVISQHTYQNEHLVPPRYVPGFADLRNGVCMGVFPHKIVEPGEYLEEDVFHKYHFITLDGKHPDENSEIVGSTEPYLVQLYDDDGKVIASYVGPHSYKCWKVDLRPGKHEVVVEIKKASGEVIEYSWSFTITRD